MADTTPHPKVAVVTGASQGIGAAIVTAFRSRGYAVVGTSRSITPAIGDPMLLTIQGDIAVPGTAEAVLEATVSRFGRVDTLVNNAGVFVSKRFTEYDDDDYATVTGVNLWGFFAMTRATLRHMAAQGSGHVVSITTTLVEHADARVPSALASLTKGGVAAATKALAVEYAPSGIRVNAVSPGAIKSSMYGPDDYPALAALHPMGRAGEVEDVVRGVMYLDSSPFVTGEFLHVDGGQSAGR